MQNVARRREGAVRIPKPTHHPETAKVLYDHVSRLLDEDHASTDRLLRKVDKLLLVNTAVVAALGYGLQRLDWTIQAATVTRTIIAIVSGLVCLAVIGAFVTGIRCMFLSARQVAGVKKIQERIVSGEAWTDPPAKTFEGLTLNLANALEENRVKNQRASPWGNALNAFTIMSLCTVATFLMIAIGGSIWQKWSN